MSDELAKEIWELLENDPPFDGYALPRRNLFLGRWMRFGGFIPIPSSALSPRSAEFEARPVHETIHFVGQAGRLKGDMVHDAYPTLAAYIAHMDRYSTLGAEQAVNMGKAGRALPAFVANVVLNPLATFVYNYFFRLGFLDGREGLLLHLYHSVVRQLEVRQGLGAGARRIVGRVASAGRWYRAVVSHISRKTSEIWDTHRSWLGQSSR